MWYWLLMGGVLLPILLFMKLNQPKLLAASKLLFFCSLIGCLLVQPDVGRLPWLWSLSALVFFTFCYAVEECIPRYRILQLFFFSIACLCYSLNFWSQVETLSWSVAIASFALVVVVFFLLLPLLDSFVLPASMVALILWQLLWASGELWDQNHSLLNISGLLGTLLLSISVLIWELHYFRKPFKHSYGWIMCCYFSAHIFIVAPLVLS
ncbi:lysoplasmalogenase family protein [Vibrio rumoiensis]|uniref:lysoplasmalogenase family protein n=1 Tax=Vibrio rumoiensis TaxID=76258 RepID=UPI003AA8216F